MRAIACRRRGESRKSVRPGRPEAAMAMRPERRASRWWGLRSARSRFRPEAAIVQRTCARLRTAHFDCSKQVSGDLSMRVRVGAGEPQRGAQFGLEYLHQRGFPADVVVGNVEYDHFLSVRIA